MYLVDENGQEIKIRKAEEVLSDQQMAYFVEKNLRQLVDRNLLNLRREAADGAAKSAWSGQDILSEDERRQYQYATKYGLALL